MKNIALLLVLFSITTHASSWDEVNSPANMNRNYDYSFSNLPLSGSLDQKNMPWSDNYWESDWGGISLRWKSLTDDQLDPDQAVPVDKPSLFSYVPPTKSQVKTMTKDQLAELSPAEKYDILMGRYDYPTVKSERARTGPEMKEWQGICHGWVPAAINNAEPSPTEAVNADGVTVPFGATDLKGLLSYYYGVPAYEYARGKRQVVRSGSFLQYLDQVDSFDPFAWVSIVGNSDVYTNGYSIDLNKMEDSTKCNDAEYAARYGSRERCIMALEVSADVNSLNLVGQVGERASKGMASRGFRDPNPGAFHVVMANQLGLMKRAFAGNINKKIRNGEIWNQPIVGYQSRVEDDRHHRSGSGRVHVITTLTYVSEIGQTWEPVVGTPKQRFSEFEFGYTLELDHNGNITGGEWDDKKMHPSFIWKHDKLEIKGYMSKLNEIYHPRF